MDVALVSGGLAIVGLLIGHWLGRRQARQDRLRALYADVLHAAIRATPRSLGYRVGPDDMRPTDEEMNLVRARLSVESEEDEDEVMQALVGVYSFSDVHRGDHESNKAHPGSVPTDELRRTEKRVRDAMDELQVVVRKRLSAADRPMPELHWRAGRRRAKPGRSMRWRYVLILAGVVVTVVFLYFFGVGLMRDIQCGQLSSAERYVTRGC